jgi:transposase
MVLTFSLSPGQANDSVGGRKLLRNWKERPKMLPLTMDKAYEGDETRQLVFELGLFPVVPPKSNRIEPSEYDRELYKRRNEIERLFRPLKGFRRIFSRFEKFDIMFIAFIQFALTIDLIRVNTP